MKVFFPFFYGYDCVGWKGQALQKCGGLKKCRLLFKIRGLIMKILTFCGPMFTSDNRLLFDIFVFKGIVSRNEYFVEEY
jgi:hypothetical protein